MTIGQRSIWNKRIPTLLALLLIISAIGVTSFITKQGTIFYSGAAPSAVPQNVHISNITDRSFTVTYSTDAPVLGSLSAGKNKTLGLIIFDDRDKAINIPQAHTIHSFTIENLSPSTTYYFSITSGNTTYLNNEILFTATTGPPLAATASSQKSISGSVIPSSGKEEILVYIQPENGQLLSTVADSQGNYVISLANLRTNDLTNYEKLNLNNAVTITLTDGTSLSHVVSNITDAQKIPPVALSQDYNFMAKNTTPVIKLGNAFVGYPSFGNALLNTVASPAITVPKKDEAFVDRQPLLEGTAMPNKPVTIVIHTEDVIQAQVTADNTGHWTFRPATPLSPGSHTISITTADASGTIQTITQSFSVFPAGTQVFQTATPSATLAPTISPTPTPSTQPKPTLAASITPTVVPTTSPTSTPTPLPTATPAPSPTITPILTATPTSIIIPLPTRPSLPSTGNSFIFPLGITSIITTIVGIGLFLFVL